LGVIDHAAYRVDACFCHESPESATILRCPG
jgi:hypothetical protein